MIFGLIDDVRLSQKQMRFGICAGQNMGNEVKPLQGDKMLFGMGLLLATMLLLCHNTSELAEFFGSAVHIIFLVWLCVGACCCAIGLFIYTYKTALASKSRAMLIENSRTTKNIGIAALISGLAGSGLYILSAFIILPAYVAGICGAVFGVSCILSFLLWGICFAREHQKDVLAYMLIDIMVALVLFFVISLCIAWIQAIAALILFVASACMLLRAVSDGVANNAGGANSADAVANRVNDMSGTNNESNSSHSEANRTGTANNVASRTSASNNAASRTSALNIANRTNSLTGHTPLVFKELFAQLWKVSLSIFICAFIFGLVWNPTLAQVSYDFGAMRMQTLGGGVLAVLIAAVLTARSKRPMDILSKAIMPAAAAIILILPSIENDNSFLTMTVLGVVRECCFILVFLAFWITCIQLSQDNRTSIVRIYSLSLCAICAGALLGMLAIPYVGVQGRVIALLALAAYLATLTISMALASGTDDEVAPAQHHDEYSQEASFDAICVRLAQKAKLSPRETEVFALLIRGHTQAFIAKELFVSNNTIHSHVRSIYRKMGVSSREKLLELVEDHPETAR
jgi:DNA-binding CsgD family transcriptional regulator